MVSENDLNNYLLINIETAKTYLINSIIAGNVKDGIATLIINVQGVKYVFFSDFDIFTVIPISDDAYAITTKGLVKWKNPSRVNDEFLDLHRKGVICSNYICIDYPSKDYIKIDKKHIVFANLDIDKYENLDVKETHDEMTITYHKLVKRSAIGVKIRNKIYPIHFPKHEKETLIISRGTCFRVDNYYRIGKRMKVEIMQDKFQDFCY